MLEAGVSGTMFPYEIELVLEGNTSCNFGFPMSSENLFVPNTPVQLS
jgi:hypothetical protein